MIRDVPQLMRNSENLSQPNLFADLMEPYNSLLKEFHAPPLPTQRALHDHDGLVVRGHQPEGDHHGRLPVAGSLGARAGARRRFVPLLVGWARSLLFGRGPGLGRALPHAQIVQS